MADKEIDKAKKKLSEMADGMDEEEALGELAKAFGTTPKELGRRLADAINKYCREEEAKYGGGRISPEAAVVLDEIDEFIKKSEGKTQEEIDEGVEAIIRAHPSLPENENKEKSSTNFIFHLSESEQKRLVEWLAEHDTVCSYADPQKQGAIGGRLTYAFTPTGLGCVIKVLCACGVEVDITMYSEW